METNTTESEKLHTPKSIPETFGIRVDEVPIYNVLTKDGDFEVRHYPKQLIAKITLHGMSYDYFREHAFEKLAAYIFEGHENKNEQLPMTDPVLQHEDPNGAWTMSFILPKNYTLATAPKPKNPEIVLEEVEPYNAAVVAYSGNNKLSKIEEHKKALGEWVGKQSELAITGHFFIAQYDAPFVVPHLKHNEVQVKVNTVH